MTRPAEPGQLLPIEQLDFPDRSVKIARINQYHQLRFEGTQRTSLILWRQAAFQQQHSRVCAYRTMQPPDEDYPSGIISAKFIPNSKQRDPLPRGVLRRRL